jgi:hypothetical protein
MIVLSDSDALVLHYAATMTAQALQRRLDTEGDDCMADGPQTHTDLTETLDRLADRLLEAGYTRHDDGSGWERPNRAQRRARS